MNAVDLHLLADEVLSGDVLLFILGIAGDLDDFHPVHQCPGNLLGIVGRGDKEHLGEILGQLHVVVRKVAVLLRIQYLQQSGGRISPVVAAGLVDLIQKH